MKNLTNCDIKQKAKDNDVFLYEIAFHLGISEPTISRWLRYDLTPERRESILNAIDSIAAEKSAAVAV